jgi:hypothetical protein
MTPRTDEPEQLLLRGTPTRDYHPKLSAEACAIIARVLDDNRADRARRLLAAKAST